MAIHVHWLPVSIFVLVPTTFLISYCIAVGLGHVEAGFPYISDTGARSPESCIFGQLLNVSAVLAGIFFYVRFRQVQEYLRNSENPRLRKVNNVALVLAFLSAFGMSMVGNFQETNVLTVHLIGAVMAFGIGSIYGWLQVYISYKTSPYFCSLPMCHLRTFLSAMISICFVSTFAFAVMSMKQFNGSDTRKWSPKDSGFVYHVLSTSSEWLLAICLLVYFLSFVSEFRPLRMKLPSVMHIDDMDPRSEDDGSDSPLMA